MFRDVPGCSMFRVLSTPCKFMQKSVTYIDCVISASGISATEEKVEGIKQAPRLRTLPSLGLSLE